MALADVSSSLGETSVREALLQQFREAKLGGNFSQRINNLTSEAVALGKHCVRRATEDLDGEHPLAVGLRDLVGRRFDSRASILGAWTRTKEMPETTMFVSEPMSVDMSNEIEVGVVNRLLVGLGVKMRDPFGGDKNIQVNMANAGMFIWEPARGWGESGMVLRGGDTDLFEKRVNPKSLKYRVVDDGRLETDTLPTGEGFVTGHKDWWRSNQDPKLTGFCFPTIHPNIDLIIGGDGVVFPQGGDGRANIRFRWRIEPRDKK